VSIFFLSELQGGQSVSSKHDFQNKWYNSEEFKINIDISSDEQLTNVLLYLDGRDDLVSFKAALEEMSKLRSEK
jgi:hypothetical protein